MFTRVVQPGLLCIFDADRENPLKLWEKRIRDGQMKRTLSDEIKGLVLEMTSKMPMANFIHCPANLNQTLGVHYPFLSMLIKLSFSTMFAFDVQVLDDRDIRRRFRASTIQTFVDIQPFMCKLPLTLETGWNLVTIPLHHLVKTTYGTGYVQTLRLALYPNCLLKRIYFSDKEYPNEDMPPELHIEETDLTETYRLKYSSLFNQKRKTSLSYYPDLIKDNANRLTPIKKTSQT